MIQAEDLKEPVLLSSLSIGDTFLRGDSLLCVSDRSRDSVSVRTFDGCNVVSDPNWSVHKVKVTQIVVTGV